MVLASGSRLGPYEIISALGAGGMGEVYRARDSRLGREVAVKVLPAAFSADPDRLSRFEQEARAAAALNHPNILAVHDIGMANGAPYIVSELLEGETLRARLSKGIDAGSPTSASSASSPAGLAVVSGGLPVRKAIDYAVQIAHGLAAAHSKGIVHRDLKPENVFIGAADGRVKILDFGLAKLKAEAPAASASAAGALQTVAPTTSFDTQPGMLLGTMGYMSPEQLRAQPVDHRADIFSFGAILYEMLGGQRAFQGATSADTISAILDKDPPDLPTAERHIPPALARIVDRCLEKNPAARFQTASDLGFALESLSSHSDERSGASPVVSRGSGRSQSRLAWAMAAVAGLAAIAFGALAYFERPQADTRVTRTVILPPDGVQYFTTGGTPAYRLGLSPDGSKVVFAATSPDGKSQLWVRALDALTAHPVAGSEDGVSPFWSPDSRFIGYFTIPISAVKRVDATGGPPTTLAEGLAGAGSGAAGATWNRDDVILYGATGQNGGPIRRVPAAGGAPSIVIEPDKTKGEVELWYPFFLPDGNHFLFVAVGPLEGVALRPLGIYVSSLDGKERKLLVRGGSNEKYANGHLLFLRESTLMAQPFDPNTLTTGGDPAPIAEQVQIGGPSGATGPFAVSENSVLAYISGPPLGTSVSELVWLDRAGKRVNALGDRAGYADIQLSRDGTRAAVSVVDPTRRTSDVWVYEVARGLRQKFTFDAADDLSPVWSSDDRRIFFSSNRINAAATIFQKTSDGAGTEDALFSDKHAVAPRSASPDGQFLLYSTVSGGGSASSADLWVLPLTGEKKPIPFKNTPASEVTGKFSQDGRWIAYMSDESGRMEIYVAPFPGSGGKALVSSNGGAQPRWSRSGTELFYISADNKLMVAEVDGRGVSFRVGPVRPLFDVRLRTGPRYQYDVSPDGQRFLFNYGVEQQQTASPITVVVNWPAGLREKK